MRSVLIVDDERIEREGIAALLQMGNYNLEILEAVNGKEALTILKEKNPEILLSDIRMPLMDGIELTRQAKILNPDMAVVIFSGFSDFNYAKEAIRNGVREYILKPVDPLEFKNVMDGVMSYLDEKKQNEAAIQKNQEFLGQYFLHKYIRYGKSEIMDDAMEIMDVSWWNRTGRMLLLSGEGGFFENYDGDFEQMLTEELPFSFHYLNYDSDSSILCFEQNVKVDYYILAKHIFQFVERSCGRQIHIGRRN